MSKRSRSWLTAVVGVVLWFGGDFRGAGRVAFAAAPGQAGQGTQALRLADYVGRYRGMEEPDYVVAITTEGESSTTRRTGCRLSS